jgi:hypothetical protein
MQCTNNFIHVRIHEYRFAKLNMTFKHALRDCFAKYSEWFASGNVRAIERYIHKAMKPNFLDVLDLSYGDCVLACTYQAAQPH